MPLTPAEKQQRYRERQRALGNAQEVVSVTPEEESVTEESVTEVASVTKMRRVPKVTEEEYVRWALSRDDLFDRERAEKYARWRYAGFCAGEIASL